MFGFAAAFGALTLAVAGACLSSACVDPSQDYNDWLARTGDARVAETPDSSGLDGSLPDGGFQETLLMACLGALAGGDVRDEVLLTATAKYTPAPGGGGTFTFSDTPLVIGATDLTQTVGDTVTDTEPVAPDGTCAIAFGPSNVPAAASRLGEIVFAKSTLHFIINGTQLCAGEEAVVTSPLTTTLDPAHNPCIFRSGTPPFPTFQSSDFHCP
ncbi:MAG TPA: hypothetical protein VIF15_06410 [Polyangiaceae bacterium]|jgi:hypothetical protein